MMLFDFGIERHDIAPAAYSEPDFLYLNRSARPAVVLIREVLESWFTRYPELARQQIQNRFRSLDRNEHLSAFFELYLHELLIRLGHSVVIPFPEPGTTTQRAPDFLATSPDGQEYYVEATLASNRSRQDIAGEKRLNLVYDALNGIDSPNFFISIEVHGAPSVPVPGGRLRHDVEAFLKPLNPDECTEIINAKGLRAAPCLHFSFAGWRIDVSPIPKSKKARGVSGIRPLGMQGPAEAQWVDDSSALKKSVTNKAAHYGNLNLGFVVAVNAINQHIEKIDVMEALYGQESFTFSTGEPQMSRLPNGAWVGPKGPKNTRVSGVLVVSSLTPWTIAAYGPEIYHNPWARHPIANALDPLPHNRTDNARMIRYSGITPNELFELPKGWPIGDE